MTRSQTALTAVALALLAILFVAINVLAGHTLGSARLDLTQQKLYTLSDSTRKVLDGIGEPVDLTLYYSKQLGEAAPSFGLFAQRVRETLEQYAALSKGRVRVQTVDPQPFSDAEDKAVAAGLQGIPVEQGGDPVYFGLAGTNTTDDRQVIPFFQPDREHFLEYDLTKLVQTLAHPKRKVIGLISSLPIEGDYMAAMQGQPLRPYAVLEQLRQVFDVRTLGSEFDTVKPDVDLLMLVHPQGLSDRTLYAIDQFALKGGRVLAFVDPNAEAAAASRPNPMNPQPVPPSSTLEPLFKAWGLQMVPDKVVGDRLAARRVALPGARGQVAEYLPWLSLRPAGMNQSDPATRDLTQVNLATAGILKPLDGAGTRFVPLFQSSPQSAEIDAAKTRGMPDVVGMLRSFKPGNEPFTMAAHITGPIATAYPDGPPKDAPKPEDGKPAPDKPAEPAKPDPDQVRSGTLDAIVVADTDLLEDRMWAQVDDFFGQRSVTPTASNGDFVVNAAESLIGGGLIGLRSRGTLSRPFLVVEDMQRDAEARYRTQEQELRDSLKATQSKLASLKRKEGGSVTLTAEQQKEVDDFSGKLIDTRRQLRKVQLALRENIDGLKAALIFINAGLVPILVAVVAAVLGLLRYNRRRRAARA